MTRSAAVTQLSYRRRFEWGPTGCEVLAEVSSYVVIVDVLRFTTAVEAAVSRGSVVYPYRWMDRSAQNFADSVGASLADGSQSPGASLSPVALVNQPTLDAVVLPSPNGSTCSVVAAGRGAVVVAACVRNAPAVARYLSRTSHPISVIACGERWADGTLRPALEDLWGAGAVLSLLGAPCSPEASSAAAAWREIRDTVAEELAQCSSGRELLERGHGDDVRYASAYGVSDVVPVFIDGAFRNASELAAP